MTHPFPIAGVIGIVAEGVEQLSLARDNGLTCVELRADLLLSAGVGVDELVALTAKTVQQGLGCLFTLRHPSHGGSFDGTEEQRVVLIRKALAAGADVVDVEWGMPAANILLNESSSGDGRVPLILSYHDFEGMLSPARLQSLTDEMAAAGPLGIKVVPLAAKLSDAARMLQWVAARPENDPARIGFAMGPCGGASRILTIAYGSPITYAAFGRSVAPGQVAMAELLELYRAHELNAGTRVYGVAGSHSLTSFSPFLHNPGFVAQRLNAVYVPLQTDDFDDLHASLDALRIDGLSITTPFKEAALRLADTADPRSGQCGAANTWVVRRTAAAGTRINAYNTDFDGVIVPIAQHTEVRGLKVAVIGNGGAARGAVEALKSSGAVPHLFYRNQARGAPVADQMRINGALLSTIDDSFDVYLNATTLGTDPGDPSPVPKAVFKRGDQIAFEMLYQNPNSQFLADAAAAGVTCVRGREMLVAQGVEQLKLFTGKTANLADYEVNFQRGVHYRF